MTCHSAGDVRRPTFVSLSVCVFCVFLLLLNVAPVTADTLTGRVLDPSGQPVAAAEVVLLRGAAVVASATTGTDGTYGPIRLDAGAYDVVVVAPGLRLPPATVTIAQGRPVARDFALALAAVQESVVVSASHVDALLSRTASSTSVITRRDLDRTQARSLSDALRTVPGLNTAPSGTIGAQTSLFLRGGESDYTLVLVDGVPQNGFGGSFDAGHLALANTDRIEVVRGPQSALYGSGAVGGIVHLISAAGGQPRASATFEAGGYGTRASTMSGSTSLGAWSFGGGLDWLSSDGDTRVFDSVGGPVSNDDYTRLAGSGSITWSDRTSRRIRLDVRGGRNERGFPGAYGSDPRNLYSGLDTISRGENEHLSMGLSAVLRSPAAIDHRVHLTWSDADGTFVSPFGESEDETSRLTGRYQLDAAIGGVGVSAGAELLRERARNTFITDAAFDPVPVERSNLGLFVEARPHLHDRLFTTVGLRTERIDRMQLAGDGSRPAFDPSVVWSTNPKIAMSWLLRGSAPGSMFSGETRLRASAGTGIKAPTAFDIAFTDNPDLRPERSRSMDVGVEQGLWQSRVHLDATWFYNSYDDLIVAVSQPLASVSRYRTDNIANARATGLEIGASLRLSDTVTARVDLTRLETEVLSVDSLPGTGFGVYAVGDALIRRPRQSVSAELAWTTRRASAFVLLHHRGDMRDLEPNLASEVLLNPRRLHTTVGGSVRIASGLEAYGRLMNLSNRQYEDVLGFPAMGRSAVIGLRVAAGH